MSKVPFMPLWVADFMAKTSDLDAKEAGAYLLILMTLWTRGGVLPADQKKLQRVARVGRDWPKVWDAISHYFTVENGQLSQGRLTEELHKANMKREVNAQAGARGGRAKALKTNEPALANASDPLKQSEPESEVEETTASAVVPTTPPNPPESKSTGRVRGAARGKRIDPSWAPTLKDYAFASKHNLTREEINREADRFRNYWLAASGRYAAKCDWEATWRNWLTGEHGIVTKRAAGQGAGQKPGGQSRGGGMVAAGLRAISEARGYGQPLPEQRDMGTGYDLDGDALRIAGGGQG